MNKLQFKAIKTAFKADIIYFNDSYPCVYLKSPIMRKSIKDIEYKHKKRANPYLSTVAKVSNNTYNLYYIPYSSSTTHYVITKNDVIIYHCFSSIFAPASSAFEVLTGIYYNYEYINGSPVYASNMKAKLTHIFMDNEYQNKVRTKDTIGLLNKAYPHF